MARRLLDSRTLQHPSLEVEESDGGEVTEDLVRAPCAVEVEAVAVVRPIYPTSPIIQVVVASHFSVPDHEPVLMMLVISL
jgi:hypothetical protein